MYDRPENAEDCDACEGGGRYPIHGSSGKLHMWIECPVCCGAGHDFGEAHEEAEERRMQAEEAALVEKYHAAMAEMRAARHAD